MSGTEPAPAAGVTATHRTLDEAIARWETEGGASLGTVLEYLAKGAEDTAHDVFAEQSRSERRGQGRYQ